MLFKKALRTNAERTQRTECGGAGKAKEASTAMGEPQRREPIAVGATELKNALRTTDAGAIAPKRHKNSTASAEKKSRDRRARHRSAPTGAGSWKSALPASAPSGTEREAEDPRGAAQLRAPTEGRELAAARVIKYTRGER